MSYASNSDECPNDCGDHCGNPAWSRADDDARIDRLRPLAEHLRIGHDVDPDLRRYRDTWLHIALLADEWFTESPVATDAAIPVAVEGVETVEWGVRLPNGRVLHKWFTSAAENEKYAHKEAAGWAAELGHPVAVVRRTRVSYPDRVSEWTPVELETSEPEGGESRG